MRPRTAKFHGKSLRSKSEGSFSIDAGVNAHPLQRGGRQHEQVPHAVVIFPAADKGYHPQRVHHAAHQNEPQQRPVIGVKIRNEHQPAPPDQEKEGVMQRPQPPRPKHRNQHHAQQNNSPLDAKESNSENDAYVADLEAQAAQWKEYKDNEQKFEEEKAKFYKEVVFSDQAPDINEYKKYYESIDPQNAENLYKQVVEQQEKDDDMSDYVKAYSQMKPKQAAAIFDTMTDNLELVAKILSAMKADARGDILGNMKTDTAAKVTKLMEP